jgi:hypothetical protein
MRAIRSHLSLARPDHFWERPRFERGVARDEPRCSRNDDRPQRRLGFLDYVGLAWMLPVAAVLVASLREPSATVAVAPWLLALAYWFLYYADHWARYYTEQSTDPASFAGLLPAFLILLGWAVVLVCAVRPWRWGLYRAFREGLDPAPLFPAQRSARSGSHGASREAGFSRPV